jgi:hypothetical protein
VVQDRPSPLLEILLQLSVSVSTNISSTHRMQINDFRIASEVLNIELRISILSFFSFEQTLIPNG